MNKIKLICIMLLSCMALHKQAMCQQDALYSQYMFNGAVINPAYPTMDEMGSITAVGRNQWVGIDGAPKTLSLALHAPVNRFGTSYGFMGYVDKSGNYQETTAGFNVSQRVMLAEDKFIALGIRVGMSNYLEDNSGWETADPVFQGSSRFWKTNVGFGLMYFTPRFFVGFSSPSFRRISMSSDKRYELKNESHFYLQSAYLFDLSNDLKLKPGVLMKYVDRQVQADINTNLLIRELVWVGASWRSSGSVVGIVQVQATDAFQIGYSYDHNYNTILRRGLQGSHEVMLNFRFGRNDNSRTACPRYF